MKTLKAKPLRKNATIGIISTSSPQRDPTRLERGITYLESLGYRVELSKHALKSTAGYLAGTDEERLEDIHGMFADKRIDAIFCARGGYGSPRMLLKLDYELIRKKPKIFAGFSDVTALQCAIFKHTGLITFSGAMPSVDMADSFHPESEESFWRILTNPEPLGEVKQSEPIEVFKKGHAAGRLFCGNLTMFSMLCGTPFLPDFKNAVLLSEDIGEEPYRIDRILSQFENCGFFKELSGLAFGRFTQENLRPTTVPQRTMEEVLKEFTERAGLPTIANVLYGHQAKKLTLPFGAMCEMDAEKGVLKIGESALLND
ncbi:MAG TPA: LD-carboxypeptidase [Patescibacteria group bacterium]|nr:LD-carboxypeptidase [Patescibacteria group bacterium]